MPVKSRIKKLTDYKTVPLEWKVSLRCPREHLQKEVRQVVRRYKQVVDAEVLEHGDVALLKLESKLPKFNRPAVPVTVGSGLFHKELEEQCIGHAPGDCFLAEIGDGGVTVTVQKASRTIYPQPTDEMVARFCEDSEVYGGISTLEAFLEKARQDWESQTRINAIYEKMNDLMEAVLNTSDWDFDPEDLHWLREQNLTHIQQELPKPLASMTREELLCRFGVGDLEALHREIDLGSERWIASILWWAALMGREPSFEDMESLDFGFLETYVKERVVYEEEDT